MLILRFVLLLSTYMYIYIYLLYILAGIMSGLKSQEYGRRSLTLQNTSDLNTAR